MRADARLLFWRENRLYRQTEVPSEGMALLFHVKQRHETNDEIVPRETSARNREKLFHVKPFRAVYVPRETTYTRQTHVSHETFSAEGNVQAKILG